MALFHVSFGGPVYRLSINNKIVQFEDHPHLGPVLVGRDGEPLTQQPEDDDLFWEHYDAWREQGKRSQQVGIANWCTYKTRMQRVRTANAAKRNTTTGAAP